MKSRNTDMSFADKKKAVLESVMPYFSDPSKFELPKLTLDEYTVLVAEDENHMMSRTSAFKLERNALAKLKYALERLGIRKFSDIMG